MMKISHDIMFDDVECSQYQVAGHDGFYRCKTTKHILKPITLTDVRSQREIYFYELLDKLSKLEENLSSDPSQTNFPDDCDREISSSENYSYSNMDLFKIRDLNSCCSCLLDKQALLKLVKHVPQYKGICRLVYNQDKEMSEEGDSVSDHPSLFLSLEDLTAHCLTPCVIDIKIGQVTYDPNATREKILEESNKYSKLSEFGFRILGMKVTSSNGEILLDKDKHYGRTLLSHNQLSEALYSFFSAIESSENRHKTIDRVMKKLDDIESWFFNYNVGQLQFISSSILIVYDSSSDDVEQSVRLALIDFAHVFHLHPVNSDSRDEKYLFGLRKLIDFLKFNTIADTEAGSSSADVEHQPSENSPATPINLQAGDSAGEDSSQFRNDHTTDKSDDVSTDNQSVDEDDYDKSHQQVIVGICAMAKKAQSKPMAEILKRLEDYFEPYIKTLVFDESTILNKPVSDWPLCDCLISFHSKGFPLSKAIEYARLRKPFLVNDLDIQYDIQDRRKVYKILEEADIELPRYAVLDRDSANLEERELIESDDHVEINNVTFNKPFVEKPISAEDHNIYIYYPAHAGGGSQRLFRKIGCRSSVYSSESRVRKSGSYIYEEFMPTDGTDVKVYTAGPDYAHAEARKSPALDGKVERDGNGKEIRYPVILTNTEKLIARRVCMAFKQTVCGFDLLRANGKSYVCDVNGFSFVKSSMKYYEDCSKILGNIMLRALAPQLHIPWSVPFQLDDPPIVPTTFGRMMELRCVIAVIRHGDRTPKQKMKMEVKHVKFFELYHKYGNQKDGHAKLKKPKQLQEVLDIARFLLGELPDQMPEGEVMEPRIKLEQLKSVLEMYGHFSGINRKVQLKYQPYGRPRRSSSEDEVSRDPSLVLILKWGGELTPAGRVQAEELGRCFRRLYPASGDYSGPQGLGLLRLHSTFRHDLKIYASDEGRVQMTAAAFAKGLLALEGELTPILFQMVKSANTNGLLDNDCESSKYQKIVKERLHDIMQKDGDFTDEDMTQLNATNSPSIAAAMKFIRNPYQACQNVHRLIKELNHVIKCRREDNGYTQEYHLYHGETWDLLQRRWSKLEKDFSVPRLKRFDISKIPDIYDCIKYDLQHNQQTLQFPFAHELHIYAKALADVVIPQEYGITSQEKLMIGLGICCPLLLKIQADLLRNADSASDDDTTESVNRLDPKYSHGVSSPGRHVRTRLYFTSESHIHSLVTALRFGGLLASEAKDADEQWRRSMEYLSAISELNYLSQIVIMLYEDPTKEATSDDRFHVEIHFSSGVVGRVGNQQQQHNLPTEPQGPGFRPHARSKNYASHYPYSSRPTTVSSNQATTSSSGIQAPTVIKEENTDDERSTNNSDYNTESDEDSETSHTLTAANARILALKSKRISRSHSAVSPISLQDLFKNIADDNRDTYNATVRDELCSSLLTAKTLQLPPRSVSQTGSHQQKATQSLCSKSYPRACSVADLSLFCAPPTSIISTAVITGSSQDLDLPCPYSLPSIRPLETLHNELSLKQFNRFLQKLTRNHKISSCSLSSNNSINDSRTIQAAQHNQHNMALSPGNSLSNSLIWSGPPSSFTSSPGPSSPSAALELWSQLELEDS